MIYLSPRGHRCLTPDKFGILIRALMGVRFKNLSIDEIALGYKWAMDNSAFSGKFNADNYMVKMREMTTKRSTCLFVVAPDVVCDSVTTARLFPEWRDKIRAEGFPVAFVGQDGCTELPDCDAFFIGGSTDWKLGKQARELAQEAKRRGLWLHMGRVNSLGRIHYAESIGCDSVDGTHIKFEPDRASLRLNQWMNQKALFMGGY